MRVEKAIQRKNETKNRENKIYLVHFSGVLENGHGHFFLIFRAKYVERRGKKTYQRTVKDFKKYSSWKNQHSWGILSFHCLNKKL